jgi:hypothetical protein
VCLAAVLPAQAALAEGPVTVDPNVAGQGTALVLAADGPLLASGAALPGSITAVLPKGTAIDPAAATQRCSTGQAGKGTCPTASRIGYGRYVVSVGGFLGPGLGQTDVTWSLDAFVGAPRKSGDAASVVLRATLLSADSVEALLVPVLGAIPPAATSTARLVRRSAGPQLVLPGLPVALRVPPPATAAPSHLELTLSAQRRTRQNFIRHIRVRTPTGYVIHNIHDHRLVGHSLVSAPTRCSGSWSSALLVEFPGGTKRTAGSTPCVSGF